MAFTDNFTKVIDGQVHFNIEDTGEDEPTNLLEYTNQQCKERGCCGEWSLPDNGDIDCDCVVARMYWNTVKLAEWENKGITYAEFRDLAKTGIPDLLRLAKIGQARQWVAVTPDAMPKILENVLLKFKSGSVSAGYLVTDDWFYDVFDRRNYQVERVTHWMPLPDGPGDGAK